ncbi:MAG: Crp/Fnr family transcriptional regulator [Rudaea sp.]
MSDVVLPHLLSRSFLFQDLTAGEMEEVLNAARTRAVKRSEYYFHQGDPATSLYVMLSGKARISQITPNGDQVLLDYVAPGALFGGVAFLGQADYPVSVQAVEDCRAAVWDGETMARLMEHYPRIAFQAMQHMSNRIQELQDRLRELSTERVERRIANTLLRLARQTGQKTPDGIRIDLALSRQDIAEMSGTTLYTVSRTLSRWEEIGIVESGRERVLIRSPHGLVAIAQDLPASEGDSNL